MTKKIHKNKKKSRFLDVAMFLVLLLGVGALLYPFVSDELNEVVDQQIINHYQKKANNENKKLMEKERQKMEVANKEMAEKGSEPGQDPFTGAQEDKEDASLLNTDLFKKHTIAVVNIPKIKVRLPIFDQTTELFLSQGAALLGGTSYPTGGESTHSVISAHRGLSKAKFFTDLPKLQLKDQFYIEINNEIHAYEVDQIKVIEPTETKDLVIQKGADYVTLFTCTPYMVNTHRLLVRGHRIPYKAAMKKNLKKAKDSKFIFSSLLWILVIAVLVFLSYLFYKIWTKKEKK